MIIKYHNQSYNVKLKDFFLITFIQIKLIKNRLLRNIHRIVKHCKGLIVVFIALLIFISITYFWGKEIKDIYSIGNVLWELKTCIFTSFILTAFVSIYNGEKTYKSILHQQFGIYVDLMNNCENISKLIYFYLTGEDYSDDWIYYTKNKFYKFQDTIKELDEISVDDSKYNMLLLEIKSLVTSLQSLKGDLRNDRIILWDKEGTILFVKDLISGLNNFTIINKVQTDEYKDSFISIIIHMSLLIDNCRIPWRRDYNLNQKIRNIIIKDNENKLRNDYYMNLFMD